MNKLTSKETLNILAGQEHTLYMYSFYDKKAKRYDTPFFCQSDLFAKRHFSLVLDKPGTLMHKYADEFTLVRLGSFDYVSAVFEYDFDTICEGDKE